MVDYRIDELAREAGTTVRNVRAYQDRGLLPSPRRQGRVGFYSDTHLARLRIIGQLLERGYSLNNIAELLGAWQEGQDIGQLLGLEAALTAPWSEEPETVIDIEELAALFGVGEAPGELVTEAVALGILEPEGDHFRVHRPRLVEIGSILVKAGVPLGAVLDYSRRLSADVDGIAALFIDLVTTHIFDAVNDSLQVEEIPRLVELVERLRPLAKMVVDDELSRAMERQIQAQLGEHLERIMATVRKGPSAATA